MHLPFSSKMASAHLKDKYEGETGDEYEFLDEQEVLDEDEGENEDENEFLDKDEDQVSIFSRPGRSQGLLYKQPCNSLIKSVS